MPGQPLVNERLGTNTLRPNSSIHRVEVGQAVQILPPLLVPLRLLDAGRLYVAARLGRGLPAFSRLTKTKRNEPEFC